MQEKASDELCNVSAICSYQFLNMTLTIIVQVLQLNSMLI